MTLQRILIADADRDRGAELALRCSILQAEIHTCGDARSALEIVRQWKPDLALLDATMAIGRRRRLSEHLAHDPAWRCTRIIALSESSDHRIIRAASDLPAYSLRPSPDLWRRMEPVIYELLDVAIAPPRVMDWLLDATARSTPARTGAATKPTVDIAYRTSGRAASEKSDRGRWLLYAGNDGQLAQSLRLRLGSHGLDVVSALETRETSGESKNNAPAMLLLDYDQPGGVGDFLVRRCAASHRMRNVPLVVTSHRAEASLERRLLNLGACRVLTKPLVFARLLEVVVQHDATPPPIVPSPADATDATLPRQSS